MKINYDIYVIEDCQGNKWAEVVNDPYQKIQVYGLVDRALEPVSFETDAMWSSTYCEECDLTLTVIKKEEEV